MDADTGLAGRHCHGQRRRFCLYSLRRRCCRSRWRRHCRRERDGRSCQDQLIVERMYHQIIKGLVLADIFGVLKDAQGLRGGRGSERWGWGPRASARGGKSAEPAAGAADGGARGRTSQPPHAPPIRPCILTSRPVAGERPVLPTDAPPPPPPSLQAHRPRGAAGVGALPRPSLVPPVAPRVYPHWPLPPPAPPMVPLPLGSR